MRVLLIKTSSMGDIIHTLPAITDAGRACPGISFDWVVEDTFAPIALWHPLVKRTIPIALRRWRKGIFSRDTRTGWKRLRKQLREQSYDLVLDAQGLVKSALLTRLARGPRAGLDWKSAREAPASWFYQRKYTVDFYQHAVVRMRKLFGLALGYDPVQTAFSPDFGLLGEQFPNVAPLATSPPCSPDKPYLVFLFGTTWASKQWPVAYWRRLATLASAAGHRIILSGNNSTELASAATIAAGNSLITVLPRLSITDMAACLAHAKAVVAVDTGFGHLAAALGVPTLSLYGSTDPAYTGALGPTSLHLTAHFPCAPCLSRNCHYRVPTAVVPACYGSLPPEQVWQALKELL